MPAVPHGIEVADRVSVFSVRTGPPTEGELGRKNPHACLPRGHNETSVQNCESHTLALSQLQVGALAINCCQSVSALSHREGVGYFIPPQCWSQQDALPGELGQELLCPRRPFVWKRPGQREGAVKHALHLEAAAFLNQLADLHPSGNALPNLTERGQDLSKVRRFSFFFRGEQAGDGLAVPAYDEGLPTLCFT